MESIFEIFLTVFGTIIFIVLLGCGIQPVREFKEEIEEPKAGVEHETK